MLYIHQHTDWPNFSWDRDKIAQALTPVRTQQEILLAKMKALGFQVCAETSLEVITQDVVKTSEIEGELLDQDIVRSSVARHLGIEIAGVDKVDRNVDGVVEMMLDATQKYEAPITQERLWAWHACLFPTGYSGLSKIAVGAWRQTPVYVVSGRYGRERAHFEAVPAEKVALEMTRFLAWLTTPNESDLILKAGIAHLWFLTIHPFDDGNGRIGRAIVDHLLSKVENSAQRFYSLSAQIQKDRLQYYDLLEKTQKGTLDITSWLEWFVACLAEAIQNADDSVEKIIEKSRFFKTLERAELNERQRKILLLLLEGFEGNLTTSKWAKIAKCSQETAHRDILELVQWDVLVQNPGSGRSISYVLKNEACISSKKRI